MRHFCFSHPAQSLFAATADTFIVATCTCDTMNACMPSAQCRPHNLETDICGVAA
eukprot:m.233692 g.233692  ORF g.233692 m.233692 type:complete len:55 (+) comp19300_c0_seq3:1693-1857(+)